MRHRLIVIFLFAPGRSICHFLFHTSRQRIGHQVSVKAGRSERRARARESGAGGCICTGQAGIDRSPRRGPRQCRHRCLDPLRPGFPDDSLAEEREILIQHQ